MTPPSRSEDRGSGRITDFALPDATKAAASDFEALENLRRLALTDQVDEPMQLKLWVQ